MAVVIINPQTVDFPEPVVPSIAKLHLLLYVDFFTGVKASFTIEGMRELT
jgi:hypothetical protein